MAKSPIHDYFSVGLHKLHKNLKGRPLGFNLSLYMPLNEKVIKLKATGDEISKNDIEKLEAKGHIEVYIHESERKAFEDYFKTIDQEEKSKNTSSSEEEEIIVDEKSHSDLSPEFLTAPPADVLMAEIAENGFNKQSVKEATHGVIEKIMSTAPQENKEAFKVSQAPMSDHASNTAILASLFAIGLKYNSPDFLQELVTAALVHDVGLGQLPVQVFEKAELYRSAEQQTLYETHTKLGLDLLKDLDFVPTVKVLTLLEDHHETFAGQGFPKKLKEGDLSIHAQILAFADLLDRVSRGLYDGVTRKLGDAVEFISLQEKATTKNKRFEPALFEALIEWFNNSCTHDDLDAAKESVEKNRQKSATAA